MFIRSLNSTIVEGPIERHKSWLAARETGDGLTGTYSGGSLDWTESVAKWSRERRARPGRRGAPGRDKAVRSSSVTVQPWKAGNYQKNRSLVRFCIVWMAFGIRDNHEMRRARVPTPSDVITTLRLIKLLYSYVFSV